MGAFQATEALNSVTASLNTGLGSVQQQVTDLQRGHDGRFADLHKDLAGIVWELSKLRADMARWQALAQLSARQSTRGAAAPAAIAAPVAAAAASAGARAFGAGADGGGDGAALLERLEAGQQ